VNRLSSLGNSLLQETGTILEANPATASLVSLERSTITGLKLWQLPIEPNELTALEALERVRQEGSVALACRIGSAGQGIEVAAVLTTLVLDGHDLILMTLRDVSERARLEDRLRDAQRMEALGKLSGGIAHDFNNLLTVISGYAELLLDSPGEAPSREDIQEIQRATLRASSLTQQLLAFSRQQVLRPTIINPNTILADMQNMLRRLIGEDVALKVHLRSTGWISADPAQLGQVILNLAIHARDAMPAGGTLLIQSMDQHTSEGGRVWLRVSDSGRGIEPDELARVFEPFANAEGPNGTGQLGLSMVYGTVKQSGGEITVSSEPSLGTRFDIYFPTVDATRQADGNEARPEPERRSASETVLVVEDDASVRALACTILEETGYRVLEAKAADEAAEIARTHSGPIHLLLTDVVMPRQSGPELAARITATRPQLRVLYMTGYVPENIKSSQGVDVTKHCLTKPFSAAQLRAKARAALADEPTQSAP